MKAAGWVYNNDVWELRNGGFALIMDNDESQAYRTLNEIPDRWVIFSASEVNWIDETAAAGWVYNSAEDVWTFRDSEKAATISGARMRAYTKSGHAPPACNVWRVGE